MAEVVRAAVEMQVDQPAAGHVPEDVALAAVDHQVDAGVLPELRLVRVPELPGATEEVVLRLEGEEAVVVHLRPRRTVPNMAIGLSTVRTARAGGRPARRPAP